MSLVIGLVRDSNSAPFQPPIGLLQQALIDLTHIGRLIEQSLIIALMDDMEATVGEWECVVGAEI